MISCSIVATSDPRAGVAIIRPHGRADAFALAFAQGSGMRYQRSMNWSESTVAPTCAQ
jgi:hypothetical protein